MQFREAVVFASKLTKNGKNIPQWNCVFTIASTCWNQLFLQKIFRTDKLLLWHYYLRFFVLILGVENQSGVTRDSAILEVERREKPQIEIYPSDNQNVVQGGSVLFQCRVMSGIPNPKITWRPLNSGRSLFLFFIN